MYYLGQTFPSYPFIRFVLVMSKTCFCFAFILWLNGNRLMAKICNTIKCKKNNNNLSVNINIINLCKCTVWISYSLRCRRFILSLNSSFITPPSLPQKPFPFWLVWSRLQIPEQKKMLMQQKTASLLLARLWNIGQNASMLTRSSLIGLHGCRLTKTKKKLFTHLIICVIL